ncbi:polyprenyl synthetase family protein [Marinivivus vitaminiproducens]|uniref:polyprenyl synthetase family protein n=1 Tax=Marinivivus vitaminiproducens TaxID=3035935 RepID=UPI0027A590F8|nr:polyprenyl synthetase family protein [Geminicoccaceae bacterium SCSIO 64248]
MASSAAAVFQANDQDRTKLERLQALVAGDLERVNRLIVDRMESRVSLIPQLAGHIVAGGGKRVRPMLTLIASQLCGYQGDRQIKLAACVEFIHTATLLHDDVVDESDLRRGSATANAVWGNKAPVLVGDFLFSRAFQLMVEDGSLRVLEILANASAVIAEGEVNQLLTAHDISTTEAEHLDVVRAKTAALFAAASQIGAVVAGRPAGEEEALRAYGENLGIAFQLVDDALDFTASDGVLGKTVGDDFREGKVTLPVVLAYAAGDEQERAFWRRTIESDETEAGDLDHAIALLRRHGAVEASLARARDFAEQARAALSSFGDGAAKTALGDLVDFCIARSY